MLPVRNILDAQLLWSASRYGCCCCCWRRIFFPNCRIHDYCFTNFVLRYCFIAQLRRTTFMVISRQISHCICVPYSCCCCRCYFISMCSFRSVWFSLFCCSQCVYECSRFIFCPFNAEKKLSDFNLDVFFFCAYVRDSLNI